MLKFSLFIILFALAIYFLWPQLQKQQKYYTLNIKGQQFKLEVARTLLEKSKGLSNRNSLCQNCGMIFIYQKESYYPFWMKDTLIPLDIIYLNSQGQIVDIKKGKPNDLTSLTNLETAQYIIELNSDAIDLEVGDTIDISILQNEE